MGIDDGHIDKTPFGLSLGSSGITPLQMTVAFGVLATGLLQHLVLEADADAAHVAAFQRLGVQVLRARA